VGAQAPPPDSALARVEAEISMFILTENQALRDLKTVLVAKATVAVEIGRRLRTIKDEALYEVEGLTSWNAYLVDRDEDDFFTRASAQRWLKAAIACENVPELATEPTKAAEIAGLDPEVQKLLGPLVAGPDYGKDDVHEIATVIKYLSPEDQQTVVKSVLKDKETVTNLIDDRVTGYALERAAAGFRREKIVKPEHAQRWEEEREKEEDRVFLAIKSAILSFAVEVKRHADELDAHGGLSAEARERLAANLHHAEVALETLRRLAEQE
jgi:hypothetical protein